MLNSQRPTANCQWFSLRLTGAARRWAPLQGPSRPAPLPARWPRIGDFEYLAAQPLWRGKPLKTLLEHVELAGYNRELINWKLDDQTYREFVLSPPISPETDGGLNWRRTLWENFYPRIRREQEPVAAAEIVVRFLRERVTIAQGEGLPRAVAEVWERQVADARGFEAVYVAAMRSVGIPSRLGAQGRAELWTGGAWQAAPRPLVEGWLPERAPATGW